MNKATKPSEPPPSDKPGPGPNYPSKVPDVPSGKRRGNKKK